MHRTVIHRPSPRCVDEDGCAIARAASSAWLTLATSLAACAGSGGADSADAGSLADGAGSPDAGFVSLRGHVVLASGATPPSTTGNLFVSWMTGDEPTRWFASNPDMMLIRDVVTRGVVVQDVDGADEVEFVLPVPVGEIVAYASLDVSHMGYPAIFGGGDGTMLGMSMRPITVGASGAEAPTVPMSPLPPSTSPPCEGERTAAVTLEAPEVAGSVGNPTVRRLCVHLPASHATATQRRYPVIYQLPSLFGDGMFGTEESARLDAAAADAGREAIVVAVDAAIHDFAAWLTSDDGQPARWVRRWQRIEHALGGAGQFISYAADWSPEAASPGYAWAFEDNGTLIPAVSERWIEHSPARLIQDPARAAALAEAFDDRIFITVGDADEFDLHPPAVKFSAELTRAGIGHQLVVTRGSHVDDALPAATLRFALTTLARAAP